MRVSHLLDAIEASEDDVRCDTFSDEDLRGVSLGRVEFEDCTFERCAFAESRAARISFERCVFTECDLSNARLATSFWRDCRLKASRAVGCDLHHSYLVRVVFEDCICSYANLAESKLEQVSLQGCDLREASLSQLRLKRLRLEACDLTRAEFFQTRLRGVDLSSCSIQALRISDSLSELRGATVGIDQAPDLLGLLGVRLA